MPVSAVISTGGKNGFEEEMMATAGGFTDLNGLKVIFAESPLWPNPANIFVTPDGRGFSMIDGGSIDDVVKSRNTIYFVIPVKTGIQYSRCDTVPGFPPTRE